ncbi:MAG TPA: hypothetical protein VH419_11210 [Nocardioidaceae bacterium]|jgi:hypothetical protein
MFGSQAIETAIGLAVMFFVIATAASMVVEVISRLLQKRARDLEHAVKGLLGDQPDGGEAHALRLFTNTSIYRSARQAAGRAWFGTRKPSYLSAKAFADATVEMLTEPDGKTLRKLDRLPMNLRDRLKPLVRESGEDLVAIKSGLERWFDEAMQRTEGSYKRWSTLVLFIVGLVFAVGGNASTVGVAQHLWEGSATREAVVDAADQVVSDQGSPEDQLESVASTTSSLQELQLPVGWDATSRAHFSLDPADLTPTGLGMIAGWLLTALLVMLGAPFWYDLLSKLVALRTSGSKPPTAGADPASSTSLRLAAQPAETTTAVAAVQAPAPEVPHPRAGEPAQEEQEQEQAPERPPPRPVHDDAAIEEILANLLRLELP